MAHDRRVIAFNTPGYGMSDPAGAPTIQGYAAVGGDKAPDLGIGALQADIHQRRQLPKPNRLRVRAAFSSV